MSAEILITSGVLEHMASKSKSTLLFNVFNV